MRVLRISHSAVVTAWRRREHALRADGSTVQLLSARRWPEGGRPVDLEPEPGEDVIGVRTLGTHPQLFLYDPRPIWRALGRSWDVIDLHEEPSALATAEVLLLRALRRVRTPYVLYSAQNLAKRYPVPFRWWERRALRGAGAVSVCNAEAARILRGKGLTAPARVIGLGVELPGTEESGTGTPGTVTPEAGTPGAGTPAAPTTSGRFRVGYAGRFLAPHKGIATLMDAVAADPGLDLVLAGDGPQAAELRMRADRPDLAGRVAFRGSLSGDDLNAFYRSLDVLAVPSVAAPGWLEQFGRVAVEAMALGVPVVVSDSGALPEVVGDAGLVVPPGDMPALTRALRRVRDEDGLAARLTADGRERARRYTWAAIAEEYRELYALARGNVPALAASTPAPDRVLDPEVVVVAYGSPGPLADALAPLAGHLPITVVDNSGDPAVRAVARDAGVRYLDPGANLGFGTAINRALADRLRLGADILLLNPDARIDLAGVRALTARLHAGPRIGAVGPEQVDDHGDPSRVRWPFPTPGGVWRQAVGLGLPDTDDGFVIGSVLLLRAAALAEVGGFDESFFLYSEETDWQRRAHDAGWSVAVSDGAPAQHTGAGTSTDPLRRETFFHGAQERYLRAHHGAVGWQLARIGVLAGALARAPFPGETGRSARVRLRLYLRGPLRAEAALGDPRAPRSSTLPPLPPGPLRSPGDRHGRGPDHTDSTPEHEGAGPQREGARPDREGARPDREGARPDRDDTGPDREDAA
ncbi:glycosyltransferase [Cellulomonas sp. RIT-PI-Y]|uniref:glycosyltransferase n=1 Tax=Cellulomonas sp. RIT-PI-Y TaxID=3035297 RepID=UPI0021DB7D94|nr:glycosyltransferase [Cellulomonas sp. RIT-PI-Y]